MAQLAQRLAAAASVAWPGLRHRGGILAGRTRNSALIAVGEWRDMHTRREWRITATILALAAGQRHCASRAAVGPTAAYDHIGAPGRLAGQLDGGLDGFGPAVTEEESIECGID